MTIRIKVLDAGYVTRVPGGTLHYPGGEDIAPAGWTTRLVLDPLGPVPSRRYWLCSSDGLVVEWAGEFAAAGGAL